jgi:hypothetical protein
MSNQLILDYIGQDILLETEIFSKKCRELPRLVYDLGFTDKISPFFLSIATLNFPTYKGERYTEIKAKVLQRPNVIENKLVHRLSKTFCSYGEFSITLYPGEKIEKVNLCADVVYPNDEELKRKFFSREKLSKEEVNSYIWENHTKVGVPIKTIFPDSNKFTFFDMPLCVGEYANLFVEIYIQRCQTETDRVILVESFMCDEQTRRDMLKIYNDILSMP